MQAQLNELCALVRRYGEPGIVRHPMPRVSISLGACTTKPLPTLYEPMLCFVLQGAKQVVIGDRTITYRGPSYLLASVDLPATGQIIAATPEEPYVALALVLDPATVAAVLLDLPVLPDGPTADGFSIHPLSAALVDPLVRLCRLFDSPADAAVLAPMCEREILYRLLQGPAGPVLRQVARTDSRLSQVRRAVAWIRQNYAEPLRIEALAEHVGMSASAFHRHFKAVTAFSPLQFQKKIRLQEARRLLIAGSAEAARVAYAVGYESASQFSREYARHWGLPPARDAARLRQIGVVEEA